MTKLTYGVGDRIFLLSGPVRTGRAEGEFTIVACLPDVNGTAQYRVRSESETFERRIVASDIDTERSHKPGGGNAPRPVSESKGAWFRAASIKVSK